MSAIAEKVLISPEEFLSLPDQKSFELLDGELVERRMSSLSSWVGGEIFGLIRDFCRAGNHGSVFPADNGFQCFFDHPKSVRKPDVSFIKGSRLSLDQLGDGWLKLVPDLIVEVISPNDLAYELDEKINLFLRAGVPLIWVVNPDVRTVRIIRADRSSTILFDDEKISGEDVLPGFTCLVSAIFPPKSSAT